MPRPRQTTTSSEDPEPGGASPPRAAGGPREWQVFTASARGAAHQAASLPNQDAVAWRGDAVTSGGGLSIAVADGHGDPRHSRSDRGARLAVQVGCSVARGLEDAGRGGDVEARDSRIRTQLVPGVVAGWRAAVEADLVSDPLSPLEMRSSQLGDDAVIAYGSTLLLALVTGGRLVLAQIGDGDIVLVDTIGRVTAPVPRDPAIQGRFTTSLCQADAVSSFRLVVLDTVELPVAVLLLASDGFGNSQAADAWQGPVGQDLLRFARDHGPAWLGRQLPAWAARCASEGSGDDTTLALLVRDELRRRA